MSQNTMLDLQNHLMAQLERLSDEDLKGKELQREIDRATAIRGIGHEVVANANVILKAEKMRQGGMNIPKIITGERKPHPVLEIKDRKEA